MDMAYQWHINNKRIEILVDMEYRQLEKINKWGVSTSGRINSWGVSTVWANQQFRM
jgi:hypothetical protein